MKRLLVVGLLCLMPLNVWAQEEEEEKTLADRLVTVVSVGRDATATTVRTGPRALAHDYGRIAAQRPASRRLWGLVAV